MLGSQRGFTLLELLVTTAIMGILAASAVQAFSAYRQRGFEAVAISYMRSWPAAQEIYLVDKGEYANADEDLANAGIKILKVPTNVPYDFSIDNGGGQTSRWWGSATPTKSGLRHFCVSQIGVVKSSKTAISCAGG